MGRFALIRREDGQSLVEFALVAPVLLLLVTGIMEFGLMFNQYLSLTDAARTGARALALDAGQSGDVCQTEESKLEGQANPTLDLGPGNFVSPGGGTDPIFSGSETCTNAATWTPGDSVTLYIQKDFYFDHLFGFVPFHVTLTAQATDSIEGQ
jgi:TadE-like protein